MSWLDLVLAVLVTAAIVLVPGLAVAAAVGLRGLWLWALAAPAGVSIVVVGALLAPLVGLGWSLLPVAVVAVVVLAAVVVLRLLLRRRWSVGPSSPRSWLPATAVAVAGAIVAVQVVLIVGAPENISQTFDNVFHLNAVRYALDTANASPLHLGSMTSAATGGVWFYPSAWHALASLVVQVTGVSIPVASNALTLFFPALVWPAGIVLLTRTLFGPSRAILVGAAAAAAALPAFPLLLIDYGVLFPYMMGLAPLPAVLAAVLRLISLTGPREGTAWPWAVATVGGVPAIFLGHPGAYVALLVFASVAVLCAAVPAFLRADGRRRIGIAVGTVAYALFVLVCWYVLRPPAEARVWDPSETAGQAVGEVVTLSVSQRPLVPVFAVLVVLGLVAAVRLRSRVGSFVVLSYVVVSFLYVVVSGLRSPLVRDILTGSWYNNEPRVAALLPMIWVPLAALGGAWLWGWIAKKASDRAPEWWGRRAVAVGAVAAVLLVLVPQVATMRSVVSQARGAYALTEKSPLLSSDEHALLMRLDEHVEPDARVAGSPWTGAGLAYALAGREVLQPHTLMDMTDDIELVTEDLRDAEPGAPVCAALAAEDVRYVLDFGRREVNDGRHEFPGYEGLWYSPAVKLVDQEGAARLYRVVGCDEGGQTR